MKKITFRINCEDCGILSVGQDSISLLCERNTGMVNLISTCECGKRGNNYNLSSDQIHATLNAGVPFTIWQMPVPSKRPELGEITEEDYLNFLVELENFEYYVRREL